MTSVVVVTYLSASTIEVCLASLLDHTPGEFEIIVVDNASSDGTLVITERMALRDERISVYRNTENLGYSRALNVGLKAAKGDVLVCLNPDTEVFVGWLSPILNAIALPDVGAVGPVSDVVGGQQCLSHYLDRSVGPYPDMVRWLKRHFAGETVETKLLIGFCMAFSRKVMERVGLMDEDLILGADDMDYSWRLRLAGYRLLVVKDSFVRHICGVSFGQLESTKKAQMVRESDLALKRKLVAHYGDISNLSSDYLFGCDIFEHVLREA
ncbi:MAG: glycosyltransferase family 2 protein [Fimbriimonadaceae bacterium]|nr:glycosyltransferase family 2 protein [Fimbriimonadaceae bacterium]